MRADDRKRSILIRHMLLDQARQNADPRSLRSIEGLGPRASARRVRGPWRPASARRPKASPSVDAQGPGTRRIPWPRRPASGPPVCPFATAEEGSRLLSNDLPVSGGGRPCRASDRTTGREERGRSPRVATVGDRAMVDLAPVRCSGGFDRKRGSPGSLPRPCGFPIVRPTSTFADDRISPILNSRMSSSRESSRRGLRSRAAIEAPSAIEQEIGLRPEAAACISVSALSHATSRTPTGDRRRRPRSPSASERTAACPTAPSDERPRFAVERRGVNPRAAGPSGSTPGWTAS